jgi:hypothetical protein
MSSAVLYVMLSELARFKPRVPARAYLTLSIAPRNVRELAYCSVQRLELKGLVNPTGNGGPASSVKDV